MPNVNQSASVALAGAATLGLARGVHAAGSDEVKVALVGCGGRGLGCAANVLQNKGGVRTVLWAVADAFPERGEAAAKGFAKQFADQYRVTPERTFVGLDAYRKAIESGADLALLCSPPGFRPAHFAAAVKAGKHVFLEKPVAVDAPGVRQVLAVNEEAKKKGLAVAVGHHLRHEDKHRKALDLIHQGAIGDVQLVRVFFNSSGVWVRPRMPNESELHYQVRNWYYFTWLSGDHIVEQHVHDLDVGNWFMQDQTPQKAQGQGGRQSRVGKDYGEIFDHHAVEFTYPNGAVMMSQCRHARGAWDSFSEHAVGTKGRVSIEGHGASEVFISGQPPRKFARGETGHQVEIDDLFAALKAGRPYNEGDRGAMATMTAILGRMATYSGKEVTWDDALKSDASLAGNIDNWDADAPVAPGPNGLYVCAMPGMGERSTKGKKSGK